jgi:hypothetical protein
VLHGLESAIWAAAYLWLGALDSPLDAMLFSVDSMATRGASGLVLPPHWQMMGALEAVDGVLLFGISTAYVFAVMQLYWPMLQNNQPPLPMLGHPIHDVSPMTLKGRCGRVDSPDKAFSSVGEPRHDGQNRCY